MNSLMLRSCAARCLVRMRIRLTILLMVMPLCTFAQRFQVGTNVASLACLGTFNAEFDVAVDRHWTVGVAGKYNPFLYGDAKQFALRQRSASVSARWWPWYVYSGWWVAGKAQWQEYNMGGLLSPRTEEGHRFGGGVTAGYSYMVSPHLNLEVGLGVWGGVKNYRVYACPTCGDKLDSGIKGFMLPSDVILAFSYVF